MVGSKNPLTTANRRVGHTHTCREHNKEADLSADKGAKGHVEEWVDTTRIAWRCATLCEHGDRYGPLGRVFFNMLTLERHKELWHYDTDGNRVITSVKRRIPVMEGNRRNGLQLPRKAKPHHGQEEMDMAFNENVM